MFEAIGIKQIFPTHIFTIKRENNSEKQKLKSILANKANFEVRKPIWRRGLPDAVDISGFDALSYTPRRLT